MKKLFASILAVSCVLGNYIPAFATSGLCASNDAPVFYMDYIHLASGTIHIDSVGNATVKVKANGYQGTTTKIAISANLQRLNNGNWETIKTYSSTTNAFLASLSETYRISKGGTYRVQAEITAYSGTASETQTVTSSEAKY